MQEVFLKATPALAELAVTAVVFGGVCQGLWLIICDAVYLYTPLSLLLISRTAFFTATSPTEAAGDGFQLENSCQELIMH